MRLREPRRVRKEPNERTVFSERTYGRFAVCTLAAAALGHACSPSIPRDYVPDTRDVRTNEADAGAPPRPGAYAYVAKRAHGAIGLAGVRNMSDADAHRFVDVVADEMERCADAQSAQGKLVD